MAEEVGIELILLALAKERGCVAQKALKALNITYDDLRQDLSGIRAGTDG